MTELENKIFSKILSAINDVLNDEDNDNYIDLKEEDGTEFFYILGAFIPSVVYNELTGNNLNLLDFNHLMNTLIVQKGFTVELED